MPFRCRWNSPTPPPAPPLPSHNNSQHVLAIVRCLDENDTTGGSNTKCGDTNDTTRDRNSKANRFWESDLKTLKAFSKTSALPVDVWRSNGANGILPEGKSGLDTNPSVLLASNYPGCILESPHFCVLSAGFPYGYERAFSVADDEKPDHGTEFEAANYSTRKCPKSFSRTVLDHCETTLLHSTHGGSSGMLEDDLGRRLKQVAGHFSLFVVSKSNTKPRFWAWNDPFGFAPVYVHRGCSDRVVLSSRWDVLVPSVMSLSSIPRCDAHLELDWDVVAEYLVLGTTLGGGRSRKGATAGFHRTLVRGIGNLRPGTRLSLSIEATAPGTAQTSKDSHGKEAHLHTASALAMTARSYTACYGACEELLRSETERSILDGEPEHHAFECTSGKNGIVRGVELAEPKRSDSGNVLQTTPALLRDMVSSIADCIAQGLAQGHVERAALTGGGDTRLLLACLMLLEQSKDDDQDHTSKYSLPNIAFQTHSKQRTDWQIARHMAKHFRLKHKRIQPAATTVEGMAVPRLLRNSREEALLSNLHDQTPLRRRQKRKSRKHRESTLSYTLHGRFGTEFLGCLCFDKSPLDIRTVKQLEEVRPRANRLFRAIVPPPSKNAENGNHGNGSSHSSGGRIIQNPIETVSDCFRELEENRKRLESIARDARNGEAFVGYDIAYAFQLQLYTRPCLSDIYKGLRGKSWFSIPSAQFSRNAITPFLDSSLLRWMLCSVSVLDKVEPYELYGRLYRELPEVFSRIPSNNKLLCHHTSIPRAIKQKEAEARPSMPKCLRPKAYPEKTAAALADLQTRFHPVFWKGAMAIFERSLSMKIDPQVIEKDSREEVRAFLELAGNVTDACLLSQRLQSFLLWYERRVLVHGLK